MTRRTTIQGSRGITRNGSGRRMVIAPSLVPTKKRDHVKTDWRDARKLLGQFLAEAGPKPP